MRPARRVDAFSRDPGAEFSARPQRVAWAPLGALLAMILTGAWWLRRSEIALYRAMGLPRVGVVLLACVETMVCAAVGLLVGLVLAVALHVLLGAAPPSPGQIALAARTAALVVCAFAVASPLLVLVATRGSPAAALKDR